MIAHVAAAGERRGRVVLSITSGVANLTAIEAALRVARAFESEVESLIVEDSALLDVASYSFAREISLSGRRGDVLSGEQIALQMRHVHAALQRQVAEMARLAEVPIHATMVCGELVEEVARACTANGPWNVVALAEPLSAVSGLQLQQLFTAAQDATGVVVVGRNTRRAATGPIVAAIEDISHLEPMLRAAERLMQVSATESVVMLLIGDEAQTHEMEGQARLLLGEAPNVTIERAVARYGLAVEVAEILRRSGGGFVLAQFGGLVVPGDGDLRYLASSLECPLFLMR